MNWMRNVFVAGSLLLGAFLSTASAQVSRSIDGVWTISDAKLMNGKSYTGTVRIAAADKFYRLNWNVGKASYSGFGFYENGRLYAGWGRSQAGILVYTIGNDGSLSGKWVFGGSNFVGTEKSATGSLKGDKSRFTVAGTNPDGSTYNGTLGIEKKGEVYQLNWNVSGRSFPGVGIRVGNQLVVGWGTVRDFGVTVYDVSGDRAVGRWTLVGASTISSETLVRGAAGNGR